VCLCVCMATANETRPGIGGADGANKRFYEVGTKKRT